MTILAFIIALGVLVFIHEWGHFLLAKLQGIGVEKFSFGFGPKLVGVRRGETTYLISALPLGGYVKLHGEEAGPSEGPTDPKSFSGRPIRDRFRVVVAGPLMNLVLALVLMPVVFLVGHREPAFLQERPVVIGVRPDSPAAAAGLEKGDEILSVDGKGVDDWQALLRYVLVHAGEPAVLEVLRGEDRLRATALIAEDEATKGGTLGIEPPYFIGNEAVVDQVSPGSPAEAAGLRPGDQVLGINGHPVTDWESMTSRVQASGGQGLSLKVKREGRNVSLRVTPAFDETEKRWLMGIQKDVEKRGPPMVERRYPLGEAIRQGFWENVRLARMTATVLGRLVTLRLSYKTLGGPIRIAQVAGAAARSSLSDFLYFLAFLSLQLGLLNLLPIPVLDGGHLLFFGLEALLRRPLAPRVRQAMEQAGFFLLVALMVLITINDVDSLWGLRQIMEKVRAIF